MFEKDWLDLSRLSGKKKWEAKTCVAWPSQTQRPALPIPSIPQVAWPGKHHGEYISVDSKLLNCYLVVFIILLFVFF